MIELYKILAFCAVIKNHRRNSMVYNAENKTILCKELGMSYNSYTKYLRLSRQYGFIKDLNKSYQVIDLVIIIKSLFGDVKNAKINKHVRFTENIQSFKQCYETIVKQIILKNYRQQQYKIDKKIKLLESISNRNLVHNKKLIKSLAKIASRNNMSFDNYISHLYRTTTKDILSGKNHIAKLIETSPTTGTKWLKKMNNEGDIVRTISGFYSKLAMNNSSFDSLKTEFKVVVPTRTGLFVSLGSKITIMH